MEVFEYICLICGVWECVEANDVNEAFDIARRAGHEPGSMPVEGVFTGRVMDCE